ncbi:hypothetical protein L7F22_043065 [Adiantum nelumboides]|nr:hypothetical protein [Adiantum nelumboides]
MMSTGAMHTRAKQSKPWKLHKLELDREENNAVVVEQDDIVYSEQQEEIADMLEVGDNLALLKSPTNIDNEDYYIVLCKEAKRVLSEQVKDGWGNVFNIGDAVVHGIYYAILPQCKNSYALLREAPTAILHADAIVAIKFPMLQAKHKLIPLDQDTESSHENRPLSMEIYFQDSLLTVMETMPSITLAQLRLDLICKELPLLPELYAFSLNNRKIPRCKEKTTLCKESLSNTLHLIASTGS